MAQSNRDRVGRALEILNVGLQPFIERELKAVHGERWMQEVAPSLREYQMASARSEGLAGDTQVLLVVMWDQWFHVFKNVLGHAERSLVSELRDTRNKWAHQETFSTDDAYRALDSVQRLLSAVSAVTQASEIERQKQELLRIRFDEQVRNETRKGAVAPIEGRPAVGLRPWREVMTPQSDVASGKYGPAEFAADLAQVHRGEGTDEYQKPQDFFQRTFLTYGLRVLLSNALRRLGGTDGDPVVELQTNFGGGKTHSLLALYHLFSGVSSSELMSIEPVLEEAGIAHLPKVQRAVLVGYALSPGQTRTKPDGCVIHTLWGELAWQLLGKDGFAMVAEADRQGVSPGSEILRTLFAAASPCLILIDELVVYVRQLYTVSNLPAGSFDANLSFAQALTEAAKAAPQTLVVATIPASKDEAGGEGGQEALVRLKNIFGRLESSWRPADAEEGFEIVRRRLFQPLTDPQHFLARDNVVKKFSEFYRSQPQEFPGNCREADYERRIKAAYPIHPELFDRLYDDWSSIEKFQRTRGVLRLMAAVVHALWTRQDANPLILPANVPIDDQKVQFELTRYMEDNWVPVIGKDIDGPQSLPLRLDSENANLGRYSACRRVARTIYLGSAPNPRNPNKGLTDSQIKLGCVQPGESASTFGDALRRLTNESTHLYLDGQRYWYSTNASVTRLAQDRALQMSDDDVFALIEERLKAEQNSRGDFVRVHPCPTSSVDIADDDTSTRLVILKPQVTHALRDEDSLARQEVTRLLNQRGTAPRHNRNALIFLAADRARMEDLKQGVRQLLAWQSVLVDADGAELNLDAHQRKQAKTKFDETEKIVVMRIPETYFWLLVPDQPDLKKLDVLQEIKMQPQSQVSLAVNASQRLKRDEMLVTQYAGTVLRREMDRIPLWRGNHVSVKTLTEDFAKYVYLPRLKTTEVLLAAIRDGLLSMFWSSDTFAYADSWDEGQQRYLGLKTGQQVQVALSGLLVKSDVAAAQMATDTAAVLAAQQEAAVEIRTNAAPTQVGSGPFVTHGNTPRVREAPTIQVEAEPTTYRRFHGSVKINPRKMGTEASTLMEEVVKHLTSLSKDGVTVTIEIQADISGGVPADTVRAITENCHTLRFDSYDFEEE